MSLSNEELKQMREVCEAANEFDINKAIQTNGLRFQATFNPTRVLGLLDLIENGEECLSLLNKTADREIKQRHSKFLKSVDCIRFYAEPKNWWGGYFSNEDVEMVVDNNIGITTGGKRAREFISQLEGGK